MLISETLKQFIILSLCLVFSSIGNAASFEWPIMSGESSDDEWRAFAKIGGGYFKIPDSMQSGALHALRFAQTCEYYPKPKTIWSFQQYTARSIAQEEWQQLPPEVSHIALEMKGIGVLVLNKLLNALDLQCNYTLATGGLSDGKGSADIKVVSYDPEQEGVGFTIHTDERFVTVLLINEPGLEGWHNDDFRAVLAKENHFFINIGIYFMVLVNNPHQLIALPHRVRRVEKKRYSFGVFCDAKHIEEGYFKGNENNPGEISWVSGIKSLKAASRNFVQEINYSSD